MLRDRLTVALLLAMSVAGHAHAQDPIPPDQDKQGSQEQADASNKIEPPTQAKQLDAVVVTGTRIPPRAGFDTLEPAQVVSNAYITDRGITNAAEAVFSQPSFNAGTSYRGAQSSFGAGVNFAARFGLGSNRLLTVVDGRRFVSSNPPTAFGPGSPGSQVDLNAIPTIMIDRVESIGIGGAPTYGSDAVSGVNNIILRKNFEGVETTIGYGITDRGDNARYNFASLFGTNFADGRGNVMISVGYDGNDGVLNTAREFYRNSYSWQPNPNATTIANLQPGRDYHTDGRVHGDIPFNTSGSDGIPGTVLIRNRRASYATWGGKLFPATGAIYDASGQQIGFGPGRNQHYQFDDNGRLAPFDPGVPFGNGNASGGDGFDLAETAQIISDLDRKNAYSLGHFDFNDNVRGFWELSWYSAKALELIDQNIYNATAFAQPNGAITFNVNNPFLDPADRALLQSLGVTDFRLSRSSRDLSKNNSSSESRILRGVAGLRGLFDLGERSYNWEASINRGDADFTYRGTGLIEQNFRNAIAVTRDGAGNIVCDASVAGTVADPNCVPLNLFGEGAPSRQALAYVVTPTKATSALTQTVFNANITGGLFDLPGGEMQFNVGYEYHKEEGEFVPSEYQRLGQGRSVPILGAKGSYQTNEFFGEVLAPLVDPEANLPGLHRLDVTGKIRRVNNSVNGWFTSYTYGLQYEPFEGLQLRGNKTRSFRAPSITELYTTLQPAFYSVPEPCQASNITSGPRPDVRQRNCEAFFAAYPDVDPATFQAPGATVLGYLSGSRELENEQADSWTAGIVFKPTFLPGLRMAADWYQIKLTNSITSLSATDIASGCFDNDEFNAGDVNNANAFCSLIPRNPETGVATSIFTRYGNGPYTTFRGWTAEINYLWEGDWGRLNLGFNGFFPKTYDYVAAVGVPAVDYIGQFDYEKRQFQWTANYDVANWRFGVAANYRSKSAFDNTYTVETRDYLDRPSYKTYDVNVGYRFNDNVKINMAVANITDRQVAFPYVVDALGRRYMMTATFNY